MKRRVFTQLTAIAAVLFATGVIRAQEIGPPNECNPDAGSSACPSGETCVPGSCAVSGGEPTATGFCVLDAVCPAGSADGDLCTLDEGVGVCREIGMGFGGVSAEPGLSNCVYGYLRCSPSPDAGDAVTEAGPRATESPESTAVADPSSNDDGGCAVSATSTERAPSQAWRLALAVAAALGLRRAAQRRAGIPG
jgi:MYXO-CTERM domain-containing protein